MFNHGCLIFKNCKSTNIFVKIIEKSLIKMFRLFNKVLEKIFERLYKDLQRSLTFRNL